jgi:hypothetical protein
MPNLAGTNLVLVTLTGNFDRADGTVPTGAIQFAPQFSSLVDASSNRIVLPAPKTVTLDANGAFSVDLLATDDPDGNPVDFTYLVSVSFTPALAPFHIALPTNGAAGVTYDLSDLVPVDASGGVWAPGGAATSDHGALTGLSDDDHTKYLNNARGDARYSALGHSHAGSSADAINVKTDHAAVGDAIRVTGNVTGTTLTLTSGTIPSGWTSGKTAVIETAGSDGVIPHVATFTRTGSTTATLGTSAGTNRTGVTIWIGTNDTSAIQAARDAWLAAISNETVEGKRFTKSLYFPPGAYIVTSEDVLVSSTGVHTDSIRGGLIHGSLAGTGTRIIFASSRTSTTAPTSDRFKGNLMTMKWRFMDFRMENISAYSANPNQTFCYQWCSNSPPQGQAGFKWINVELSGAWRSGWALDGDNDANQNSEQEWVRCRTRYDASFTRALFECGGATETGVAAGSNGASISTSSSTLNVGDTTGFPTASQGYILAASGWFRITWTGKTSTTLTGVTKAGGSVTVATNDRVVSAPDQQAQFVNYLFDACHWEYVSGTTYKIVKGGFVNVIGGSHILGIGLSGSATTAGDFIDLAYQVHNDDTNHFAVNGARFEKRTTGTHLLSTYWAKRNSHISFRDVTVTDNLVSPSRPESRIIAIHSNADSAATQMPHIVFENCQLPGYAEYTSPNGAADSAHGGLVLRQCNFRNWGTQAPGNAGSTFLRWTGANTPRYRVQDCGGVTAVSNMN